MTNREKNIVGQVLAKTYRIERFLGAGTVGTVYVARHVRSGGLYAVKVLHRKLAASPDLYQRFQDEARIIATLRHPHIAPITDFDRDDNGIPFFVMDLLEGESLQQRLKHRETLPAAQALEIVQQVGSALHTAHRSGIVHRNVKPENVFLVRHDLGDRVTETAKVTDFGLARFRRMAPAGTRDAALGVSAYMAPELLQETSTAIDGRVDQWALAVILYRMLSGKLPFEEGSAEEVARRITSEPPRPLAKLMPELPATVVAAISRGMAKRKEDRYETMMDFVRALAAKPPEVPDAPPTQTRTNPPSGRILAQAAAAGSGQVPPPMPHAASGAVNRAMPPVPSGPVNRPPPSPLPSVPVLAPASQVTPSDAPTTPGGMPAILPLVAPATPPVAAPPPGIVAPPPPATSTTTTPPSPPLLMAPPLLFEESVPPVQPPRRGPSWGLLIGGVALAAMVGIGVTLLWERNKPQVPVTPPPVAQPSQPAPPVAEPLPPASPTPEEHPAPADAAARPTPVAPQIPVPPLRGPGQAEPEAPAPTAPGVPAGPAPVPAPTPAPGEAAKPATPPGTASAPAPGATKPVTSPATGSGTPPGAGTVNPVLGAPTRPVPVPPPPGQAGTASPPGASPVAPPAARPKSDDIDELMNRASPGAEPKAPAADRPPDEIMREAQAAYVRGERQRAIDLALQVAERNSGRESASAWRFIGSAACSIRAHALASRAYSSLTTPEHRQMLVDLCQRNGLILQGERFVPEEQH